MRILYLISYAGGAGTEKYVADLMRVYAREGHDCRLAFWQAGRLSEWTAAVGYPVIRLNMAPGRVLRCARQLARYCRDNRIDVVHAQYPRENVIAVLSRLWRRETKVAFTSHLTMPQGLLWRVSNRILTPFDLAAVAVCSPGAALLRENGVYPPRIRYIPNGVESGPPLSRLDRIREEFGLHRDCFVMLTFARYVPEKGLDVLLEALRKLRAMTNRPFSCLIAGDGPDFDPIRRRIREWGLTENVIQAGYRRDTEELLRSADAYVSSSVRAEAMSCSILEAMRAGLPLVVTDVGAGKEMANGCGFVTTPGNPDEMAHSLRRLINDPSLCRSLGEEAYRRVNRKFDLQRSAHQLMKLYES